MMHLEDFRAAAAKRFQDDMASSHPGTKIRWSNQPFEQPDREIWVSFEIMDGDGFEAEIGTGTKTERYPGVIQMTAHVPEDTGERDGTLIAQDMARIFTRQQLSGNGWNARFRVSSLRKMNRGDVLNLVVRVNYERDERNSD